MKTLYGDVCLYTQFVEWSTWVIMDSIVPGFDMKSITPSKQASFVPVYLVVCDSYRI